MADVLLDALIDSLKVFATVLIVHILLSFFENRISRGLEKNRKVSPLLGAAFGLIPQCGFSVVAADLYIKQHITMGTVLAVFIACSDEALPILLSDFSRAYMVLPLLGVKFVLGFFVGYLADFIMRNNRKSVQEAPCCEHAEVHFGCCHHDIDGAEESKLHRHLLHPLLHSLKIFAYVFVINLLFGLLFYFIGEEVLTEFLIDARYFGPLYATVIGMIPNCASSVVLSELLIMEKISFGTALAGLIVNAGLGMVVLLKKKSMLKKTLILYGILIAVSLIAGYISCLLTGF